MSGTTDQSRKKRIADVGKWLLDRRNELAMSRTDLSPMVGVSSSTIKRIETGHGETMPNAYKNVLPLLRALMVDQVAFKASVLYEVPEYKELLQYLPPSTQHEPASPNVVVAADPLKTQVDDKATGVPTDDDPTSTRISRLPSGFNEALPYDKDKTEALHFTNPNIKFHGRSEYCIPIAEFLRSSDRFRWCLVTGREGSGKSRLALQVLHEQDWLSSKFSKYQGSQNPESGPSNNWIVGFCRARELRHVTFNTWRPVHKTLLIIDYAGEHAQEVHQTLMELNGADEENRLSFPLRVMLLERFAGQLRLDSVRPGWLNVILGAKWGDRGGRLWSTMSGFSGFNAVRHSHQDATLSLYIGSLNDDRNEVESIVEEEPLLRSAPPDVLARTVEQARHALKHNKTTLGANVGDNSIIAEQVKQILSIPDRDTEDQPFWLPLHVLLTTEMLIDNAWRSAGRAYNSPPQGWQNVIVDRTKTRLQRWISVLREDHEFSLETTHRYLRLLWLTTLTGGFEESVLASSDPTVTSFLPSMNEWNRRVFEVCFSTRTTETWIGPFEPDLLGEWFVKMLYENPPSPIGHQPNIYLQMTEWAFHHHPASLEAFRQRSFRNLHGSRLWDLFENVMGRYATPFGHLYDDPDWQEQFLGGRVKKASGNYENRVLDTISESRRALGRQPVVIDIMAGGNHRTERLLSRDHDFKLLAIDRDLSRLKSLTNDTVVRRKLKLGGRFAMVRQEIDGHIGMADALKQHLGIEHECCDIIIGRKALHEISWSGQIELLKEIGQTLRPGGSVVLYADGPHRMSEDGRHAYDELIKPLINGLDNKMDAVLQELLVHDFSQYEDDAAGIFLNVWCKLKDWNDRNVHEQQHRYFSSYQEICAELEKHGMKVTHHESHEFELHAARFNENGINRIGYLQYDQPLVAKDVECLLIQGDEHRQYFLQFTQQQLGSTPEECTDLARSGYRKELRLRWGSFDFSVLCESIQHIGKDNPEITTVKGPLIHLPAHVFVSVKA